MRNRHKKWFTGFILLVLAGGSLLAMEAPEHFVKNISASSELDEETEKAREVHLAVGGFLETMVNVERAPLNEEEYFAKTEDMSRFVTEEFLGKLYLTREEIEEMMGIEAFFAVDPFYEQQTYSRELLEGQIYIDYETLGDRKVFAIAYLTFEETNGSQTAVYEDRMALRIEKDEGRWLVDGYYANHMN